MTIDDLKKKLRELQSKKELAKSIQIQIARKREEIDCLKAVSYDKPSVKGGQPVPAAERFVEYIERLEKRYEAVIAEVFEIEDFISENLVSLSPIEQTIIIERYMSGKSWRKIQAELHYEERQPYRIADKALQKLSVAINHGSK